MTPKPARPIVIYSVAALLVAIWGSTWAAIRIGLEGIPPFTGVALRFGIAALVVFAVGAVTGVAVRGDRRLLRLWAIQTVFTFSLSYGVVYWAEQWVPSGLGAVLFATFPLFVAVLAAWWLEGERLTGRSLVGIAIGFGGVALIFSNDLTALGGRPVLVASLVFLISPMSAAVAHVLVKKWGSGYHPLQLITVPMAATALLMGGVAALTEAERPLVFDARSVGALLYLAVFGSAITFSLYYWVLARVPATRLALITYGIPVFALFIGTLVLDEPLTLRTVLGTALVILGVARAN